jgi:integrase
MELRPGLKDVHRPAELIHAYIVLSLLAGIRTEEARALHWSHVDLDGDPAARPSVPPHLAVWRSVRAHGETKTERSRRTLGLPAVAVQALRAWSGSQAGERLAAGKRWQDIGLVFTNHLGAALDAGNVRKMFKRICTEAGAGGGDGWTPREPRTTFVSLLSHRGGQHRGDRPASGARLHPHHRDRLPPGTAARHHHRRRDHGRALHRNLGPVPVREPPRTRTQPAAYPWLPDLRPRKRQPSSRSGSPSRNGPAHRP